jgi:hypothetical protein
MAAKIKIYKKDERKRQQKRKNKTANGTNKGNTTQIGNNKNMSLAEKEIESAGGEIGRGTKLFGL